MTNEVITMGLGLLMFVTVIVLAVLLKRGVVTKKELSESIELIQKTTQLTRDEIEEFVGTTNLLKDFVQKNYHEGQEFAEQLMKYLEELKKQGIVLKEVPVEVEHIVDEALQTKIANTPTEDQLTLDIHVATDDEKKDIHRTDI